MRRITKRLLAYTAIVAGTIGIMRVGADMAYSNGRVSGLEEASELSTPEIKERVGQIRDSSHQGDYPTLKLAGFAALIGLGLFPRVTRAINGLGRKREIQSGPGYNPHESNEVHT